MLGQQLLGLFTRHDIGTTIRGDYCGTSIQVDLLVTTIDTITESWLVMQDRSPHRHSDMVGHMHISFWNIDNLVWGVAHIMANPCLSSLSGACHSPRHPINGRRV